MSKRSFNDNNILESSRTTISDLRNQFSCIETHIEMLVDPTILSDIGADKNGEHDLQLRVMRIFSFLDASIKAGLDKDRQIVAKDAEIVELTEKLYRYRQLTKPIEKQFKCHDCGKFMSESEHYTHGFSCPVTSTPTVREFNP
jgi:hypothetical protein